MKIKATWSYAHTNGEQKEGYIIAFVGDRLSAMAIFVSLNGQLVIDNLGHFKVDMNATEWIGAGK